MNEIVSTAHLAIGLFSLWFLYFFGWREHRIDAYRQGVFAVRDELFDFAASGAIRFDDPAYTTLRDLSNGLIRYAHRLTFTRVWVVACSNVLPPTTRMEKWMEEVQGRPRDVRDKLLKAHEAIAKASLRHVVAWSPVAWFFLLASVVVNLLRLRVKIEVARGPEKISAVLEEEALEQSSLIDDDSCLAAV